MHMKIVIGLVALSALTSAGLQDDKAPQQAHRLEQASKLFAQSCVNCHTAPDTRFETDRAWLKQVYDTA